MKGILVLIPMFLLLGCLSLPMGGEVEKFTLGIIFTLAEGETQYDIGNTIEVRLIQILDSRCPEEEGVVCVWEGELGAQLEAREPGRALPTSTLYLGMTQNKTGKVGAFTIELVAVDVDSRSVVLKVTQEHGGNNSGELRWFSIEPVQCGNNAWEEWGKTQPFENEAVQLSAWLKEEHGITIQDYATKQESENVCLACDCPRGDVIAVLVDESHRRTMEQQGFTFMGLIGCTEDAKICPDGSGVGRVAPFCGFAPCPGEGGISTQEACTLAGGDWARFGLLGVWMCDLPTQDGGISCSDSDDCESVCMYSGAAGTGSSVVGECYARTVLLGTCLTYVENGKVDATICID